MKKNKERRVFSRVLAYLSWATARHLRGEHATAYREVTAAKRLIKECGFEDVKVAFYDREYHIQFTAYRYRDGLNRYYTVSASHGYVNEYHTTNRDEMRNRIGKAEFERDCTLRRGYSDYQMFWQYADNILFWALTRGEYEDYWLSGNINDIPYDVSIRLWRQLRECAGNVVNEAILYKKVVL